MILIIKFRSISIGFIANNSMSILIFTSHTTVIYKVLVDNG